LKQNKRFQTKQVISNKMDDFKQDRWFGNKTNAFKQNRWFRTKWM